MEEGLHHRQERGVNDLLQQGFFKTTRARSPGPSQQPAKASAPALLTTHVRGSRNRSRSRSRHQSRRVRSAPPPPSVEGELDSLARELSAPASPTDLPPHRGNIDQRPVILEAGITEAEAASLYEQDVLGKSKDNGNSERRFVFVSQSDKSDVRPREGTSGRQSTAPEAQTRPAPLSRKSSSRTEEKRNQERKDHVPRPEISRKKSRQDLPSIQTKLPKEMPPTFRRSASAYDAVRGPDDRKTPRTPLAAATLLTPDLVQSAKNTVKDFFGYSSRDDRRDKRNSAGSSMSGSRAPSPMSERVSNDRPRSRSRAPTTDRGARTKQTVEIHHDGRADRPSSRQSDRSDSHRSSKSKTSRYHTSSEDGSPSSDTEKSYKLRPSDYDPSGRHRMEELRTRPESAMQRPSFGSRTQHMSSPVTASRQNFNENDRAETFPRDRKGRDISRPLSPMSPSDSTPRPATYLSPLEGSSTRARSRSRAGSDSRRSEPSRNQKTPTPQSSSSFTIPSCASQVTATPNSKSDDDDRRSAPESKRSWQPPPFQPPSPSQKPGSGNSDHGTYRRYSEDVSSGSIAPLPSCPRTDPVSGRNDWLTLPRCPTFNICPSCYKSSVAHTQFRGSFIPSPIRSTNEATVCDFGSLPWYRIAWLLLLKEEHRDLRLFYGLAHVIDTAQPCLGRHEAVREWYTLMDPKTNSPIRTFAVCSSCVRSVEVILPALKGIFIRITDQRSAPRRCDLRFDSPRFIGYFDALEVAAESASNTLYGTKAIDSRSLGALVKHKTMMDECQQDRDLHGKRWFFIPSLPEFTVCEECFEEIIAPALTRSRELGSLAKYFHPQTQRLDKASCQLYGARMRNKWLRLNEKNDWPGLVHEARTRRAVEENYKKAVEGVRRDGLSNGRADIGNSRGNVGGEGWKQRELEKLMSEWRAWNAGP